MVRTGGRAEEEMLVVLLGAFIRVRPGVLDDSVPEVVIIFLKAAVRLFVTLTLNIPIIFGRVTLDLNGSESLSAGGWRSSWPFLFTF